MTDVVADDDVLAELFANLALEAGAAIMRVYERDPQARAKKDASPVCDADVLGEDVILKGLARLVPQIPVVAEELCENGTLPKVDGGPFILVDALDGTKEFLQKRDSFTVNIALIRERAPAVGAVYAPARGELFLAGSAAWTFAATPGSKAPPRGQWRLLRTRPMPEQNAVAVASRSHRDAETDAFLARLPVRDVVSTGSSMKFCLVAAGEADVYPRFGRTMEWDIAAGDAVLRRAGGMALDLAGAPIIYGKEAQRFANEPFIAWGDPRAAALYPARAAAGG
ncbi:3'(2'),5'-bisphosphate nucleotidase CysQ [Rhodoblastus acidophilus]|uniref:3'(2'),5'-bisphosphate nucleotidase CysQ n=1 Tax=Candidatus Rhodoblastus alkanivorans TaxID=2954117 RepID=A0ABS9ZAJ7_9HYPH|nr:3'(2'),5'-bisphosphate nucleotidase CysQ [Candidatus Rhodoblastus alkanivorans]MCI4677837.1 3'(2'),5'-bisphosphate nucleotidase CysQ [Candidatus Rhodoblastus alkanivorans]MCI4684664.1 3'(2'),5'-bisphosphate nucleotidase CysQ [Candidatus Rhodoblastus alkanivorans]MDI4641986.1 3'(2'),5'-bisphosphate nucleotidase CysQ [Rhodoblastus acidophilus]